jgi:hypothetical protein
VSKSSEFHQRIADNIQAHGWHCLHIASEDESESPFSYSIGFFETFGAPEVFLFNLEPRKAHSILAVCADILREGGELRANEPDPRVLKGGYKVVFRALREDCFGEYAGTAMRHYGDKPFPALVMFLPDSHGRYPWDPGYDYIPADEALSVV